LQWRTYTGAETVEALDGDPNRLIRPRHQEATAQITRNRRQGLQPNGRDTQLKFGAGAAARAIVPLSEDALTVSIVSIALPDDDESIVGQSNHAAEQLGTRRERVDLEFRADTSAEEVESLRENAGVERKSSVLRKAVPDHDKSIGDFRRESRGL
jgi:hypothetical protein